MADIVITEFMDDAIAKDFSNTHKRELTTTRLNEVYAANRETSTLEPEIASLQYHS